MVRGRWKQMLQLQAGQVVNHSGIRNNCSSAERMTCASPTWMPLQGLPLQPTWLAPIMSDESVPAVCRKWSMLGELGAVVVVGHPYPTPIQSHKVYWMSSSKRPVRLYRYPNWSYVLNPGWSALGKLHKQLLWLLMNITSAYPWRAKQNSVCSV